MTGITLMAGVIMVAASQGLSEPLQVLAAAIRDLGFAGMGSALIGHGANAGRRAGTGTAVGHSLAS
jgi:hypothetical protein